jgi:hypothetical protein
MKQCISQCGLVGMPHNCCHTTRTRQGGVHISWEGRADSPQIIIHWAFQQEVLQILDIACYACSSQDSHFALLGSAVNRAQPADPVLSRHSRPALATLFNLQMRTPNAQLGEVPHASKWQTQAHVGRRSRARKQVNLGVHWGHPTGIWHMATPLLGASGGSAWKGP